MLLLASLHFSRFAPVYIVFTFAVVFSVVLPLIKRYRKSHQSNSDTDTHYEPIQPQTISTSKRVEPSAQLCEYCGRTNNSTAEKCRSCGAPIAYKKGNSF